MKLRPLRSGVPKCRSSLANPLGGFTTRRCQRPDIGRTKLINSGVAQTHEDLAASRVDFRGFVLLETDCRCFCFFLSSCTLFSLSFPETNFGQRLFWCYARRKLLGRGDGRPSPRRWPGNLTRHQARRRVKWEPRLGGWVGWVVVGGWWVGRGWGGFRKNKSWPSVLFFLISL